MAFFSVTLPSSSVLEANCSSTSTGDAWPKISFKAPVAVEPASSAICSTSSKFSKPSSTCRATWPAFSGEIFVNTRSTNPDRRVFRSVTGAPGSTTTPAVSTSISAK